MADATSLLSGGMDYSSIAESLGISVAVVVALFAIISIWTIIWKGVALWKSARKSHKIWFVVLLIINTVGILEILYIFVFSKMGPSKGAKAKPAPKKKK